MFLGAKIGRTVRVQAILASLVMLIGCELPRDPEGTLVRARGRTLRVGVTENSPWVVIRGQEVTGIEAALMRQIADSLDAKIEWTFDSEGDLLKLLEQFEIDAVIGGLRHETPWRDRIALTQAYYDKGILAELTGSAHVIALPPGENGWLLYVDRWLQDHRDEISQFVRNSPS